MQVICLEDAAFYALLEETVARVIEKISVSRGKWVSGQEAMQLLNIKAKSTLQDLRNTGRIRYSQIEKKVILYDRDSIMALLERHAKDTF